MICWSAQGVSEGDVPPPLEKPEFFFYVLFCFVLNGNRAIW